MHPNIQSITLVILITIQLTSQATTKPNARPVYEVINEQARIDDKVKVSTNPGVLPYGNPLAGNSKQNARLHASNQQAMFNAERIRQHKAQLQRWNRGPQIMDSYMKAYHELQENHQLEIEQQQATLKDDPVTPATKRNQGRPLRQRIPSKRVHSDALSAVENEPLSQSSRVQNPRRDLRRGPSILKSEATKITREDAINSRSRNHRSYGTANYNQYLEPLKYKRIFVSPTPSEVIIKPHGNAGLNRYQPTKLHTQAIPSEPTPTYPRQYGEIQKFNSVQEIEALNSLLTKNATQQLNEFKALLNNDNTKDKTEKEIPIDFYFYLKDPSLTAPQHLDQTSYYASAYTPNLSTKDHKPITEEVHDIQDPNNNKPIQFTAPILTTKAPETETVTTKTIENYYKLEVASQTITERTVPSRNLKDDKTYPLKYGYQHSEESKKNERHLHYDVKPTGVQHLSEDGTETSAFGDDNVSIPLHVIKTKNKVRNKRSKLDTEPFLLPDKKITSISSNNTDTPTSEALLGINPFSKKRVNDFNVFLPNFPIGEATDYNDYDYDAPQLKKHKQKHESFYEDEDYGSYDDFSSPDYDYESSRQTYQHAPTGFQIESKGSYSNKYRHFRRAPGLSPIRNTPPSTSYGVPFYGHIYSTPQSYIPKIEVPKVPTLGNFQNIEPVYMLTQSQLKDLIGHHNLNIQHLDVYQLLKENKAKKSFHNPQKYRKRNPFRHVKNNLIKLHKFNV